MGDEEAGAPPEDAKAVFVGRGLEGSRVCFLSEKGYFHNESIADGQRVEVAAAGLGFVRVEVRNATDVVLGLTNPVFSK